MSSKGALANTMAADSTPRVQHGPRLRTMKASQTPFAGRLGGNLEFTAGSDDEEKLQKRPDAAPIISLKQAFNLSGFREIEFYKFALIEGFGTCLLLFVLDAASLALTQNTVTSSSSPLAAAVTASLINWVGLSLFVFSFAPASGGHLNPTITLATFFAGLSSFPRTVLYMVSQSVGAIVGAYWLRLGVGNDSFFPSGVIPGCTVDPALVSRGQLFALEYMFALMMIVVSFGVGLEPRNAKVYGLAFAPVLVGLALGLGTLSSALVKEGYTGMSFNSARCLGLMTAKGDLQYHWIHWLATLSACALHGLIYFVVPPYEKNRARREILYRLESRHD